jgi:hypothetical protein
MSKIHPTRLDSSLASVETVPSYLREEALISERKVAKLRFPVEGQSAGADVSRQSRGRVRSKMPDLGYILYLEALSKLIVFSAGTTASVPACYGIFARVNVIVRQTTDTSYLPTDPQCSINQLLLQLHQLPNLVACRFHARS